MLDGVRIIWPRPGPRSAGPTRPTATSSLATADDGLFLQVDSATGSPHASEQPDPGQRHRHRLDGHRAGRQHGQRHRGPQRPPQHRSAAPSAGNSDRRQRVGRRPHQRPGGDGQPPAGQSDRRRRRRRRSGSATSSTASGSMARPTTPSAARRRGRRTSSLATRARASTSTTRARWAAPRPGDLILGNVIGLDARGRAAIPNLLEGILINGASSNTIGGTTPSARNVISGNSSIGIEIQTNGTVDSDDNLIEGDYIGSDASGSQAVGNLGVGVRLMSTAPATLIGGAVAGGRQPHHEERIAGDRDLRRGDPRPEKPVGRDRQQEHRRPGRGEPHRGRCERLHPVSQRLRRRLHPGFDRRRHRRHDPGRP